jgi:hypothetical protein
MSAIGAKRTSSLLVGMATITAFIRFTNVRNGGFGVVMLDLERGNQCILGLDLSSVRSFLKP